MALQIKAGFLTEKSLSILFERSERTIKKLKPLKKKIPGASSGVYLLSDVKEALVSSRDIVADFDF